MCSRFFLRAKLVDLQGQFNTTSIMKDLDIEGSYAPTDRIPVIDRNKEKKENKMTLMRWGLIPHFITDFEQIKKYSMFNARVESLEEKPAFQSLLDFNRCLIPADIFYEFKSEGKRKDKYAFTLKPESTFAMAGLWDRWTNPRTKEEIFSCTVITTIANEIVKPIHEKNRMPLILEINSYEDWLNSEIKFSEQRNLLKPFESSKMKVEKVVREDTPNLTLKSSEKENLENTQPSLFGSK